MNEPDPIRDIVLVLTNKQLAALVIAATSGLVYMSLRNGKPRPEDLDLFIAVDESVEIANIALGNPPDPEFQAMVERLRRYE